MRHRPSWIASLATLALTGAWGLCAFGAESQMTLAQAEALTREIAPKVEALRGARFSRPVPVKLVDQAQARAHFRARIEKTSPQGKMATDQQVMAQLGLIPAGTDLMKTILDLMQEQAGAYYDPETGTFFVLSDMPRESAPLLVAHELTHALDDQRFKLDTLIEKVRDDDDRGTAMSSVAEGSATLVMTRFIVQEMQAGRLTRDAITKLEQSEAGRAVKLSASPDIIRRSLVGPYLLGAAFLMHGAIPADLDRVFRDPPTSTEQLIHPEKYWDPAKRDVPWDVRLPDLSPALGEGWSLAGSGTLGEMVLAVLTGTDTLDVLSAGATDPSHWTNAAATGWGGDAYQHYVNGARHLTLVATRWDTPGDAAEFEAALAARPALRLLRRNDMVVVLAGDMGSDPVAVAEAALAALASGRAAPGSAVR